MSKTSNTSPASDVSTPETLTHDSDNVSENSSKTSLGETSDFSNPSIHSTEIIYEREGEVAADYLEEFLDIIDMDGDLDIEIKNGRTYISITDPDNGDVNFLIGQDAKVLNSLQDLSRLVILNELGARSQMILDIQGHRRKKTERIQDQARVAIDQAQESGEPVHLKPMGAFERKLVHDEVARQGFGSCSEGEARARHVVVFVLESDKSIDHNHNPEIVEEQATEN